MKIKLNNKYIKWGLTLFLVAAASIVFYYLLFHGTNIKQGFDKLMGILMPILFGLAMAYLMTPVLNFFENKVLIPLCDKMKIPETKKRQSVVRAFGILITIVLVFAVIYTLVAMMISSIVPSIASIISNFDGYTNNFIKWLNKFLSDYPDIESNVIRTVDKYSGELETWLNDTVLSKSSMLLKTVSLSIISVFKFLWNILIGLIISVYVLASKEKFTGQAKKLTYSLFDREYANIVINNFRFTHRTFIGFISGKILDSIIIGLLCFIGTSIMQTPYAALVSVIVGVTNVIPFFGPYLGAIPSAILILVVDPMHPLNCVYFAIFILILQQFDGNFLGPKILGNSTGLTGFWVIFAITLFGGLFGIMGMFVGVPIFAVIYAAIRAFVNASLKKKEIPVDSDSYIYVDAITKDGLHEYIPDYKRKKNQQGRMAFGSEFLVGEIINPMDFLNEDDDETETEAPNAVKAEEKVPNEVKAEEKSGGQ